MLTEGSAERFHQQKEKRKYSLSLEPSIPLCMLCEAKINKKNIGNTNTTDSVGTHSQIYTAKVYCAGLRRPGNQTEFSTSILKRMHGTGEGN